MFFKSKTSKFSFNILYSAFFILFLVPILYSSFLILDSNKPDSLTRELVNPLIINVAYATEPTQTQIDQTASILSSIQSIINKLKIDIQALFGREVKAATETIGLVRQNCTGYSNCFTSLSDWEAAYGGITFGACAQGDLVCADKIAVAQIDGAWTAADTTAVTIDGWTTDATHYIRIYTTTAARHTGKWDTGKYRLQIGSNWTEMIRINENYTIIEGLQIDGQNYNDSSGISVAASNIKIRNNILKRINGSATNIYVGVINIISLPNPDPFYIYNNIVYDSNNNGINIYNWTGAGGYIYNNTVYGTTAGIKRQGVDGAYPTIKNNISVGNTADYSSGNFINFSNNISSDVTSPNETFRNKTVIFVSTVSGSEDFHLSSSDTSAKDAGANLSADANLAFSDDIDGNTRPVGTAWDIGADEEPTVLADTTPPVLSSGSPTGALPSGTTQTTLSVSTNNENATCKYGTTPNTAYGSITNTFTTTGGTSHSQTITGLTNGTSYNYYVRCQDTAGNANATDYPISFSVAISAGDATPPVVSIISPTNGATVSGTITVSANATDNVAVSGVQFKLDTTTNLSTEDTTSPYSYSLNIATITDGSHTLTAVARDTSNNYATSSIITITVNNASPPPPDTTPPSIPTGLIVTAISSSQINLSWTASTDNVGVTGYKIYRCVGSACAPTTQIATSTTNSYSDTGLTASTAYTYAVSAYDAAGNNSGQSTQAQGTTQASAPGSFIPVPTSAVGRGLHPRLYFSKDDIPTLELRTRTTHATQYNYLKQHADAIIGVYGNPTADDDMQNGRSLIPVYAFIALMEKEKGNSYSQYVTVVKNHARLNLNSGYGSYNDFIIGNIIHNLSISYDWLYDELTPTEKQQYVDKIIDAMSKWNDRNVVMERSYYHNWFFIYSGQIPIGALSFYGDGYRQADAQTYLDLGKRFVDDLVTSSNDIAPDGGWAEGFAYLDTIVGGYFSASMGTHATIFEVWKVATGINRFPEVNMLKNYASYIQYSIRPKDGTLQKSDEWGSYFGPTQIYPNHYRAWTGLLASEYSQLGETDAAGRHQWLAQKEIPYDSYIYSTQNRKSLWDIIWYNPNITPIPPDNTLPKAKVFIDNGFVIMRNGFTSPNDFYATFSNKDFYIGHQHNDNNAFTIEYNGAALAIDSGYYDGWGGVNSQGYYHRTTAHNSILVVDPNKWLSGSIFDEREGGQYTGKVSRFLFDVTTEGTQNNIASMKTNFTSNYDYIWGDATDAYKALPGYKTLPQFENYNQLNNFTRQFIRIKPKNYIVTFDRVSSKDKSFQKKWLLHTLEEPEINGSVVDTEVAGHILSYNGDMVKITKDNGRLFHKVLLPNSYKIRKVGGSGYEFWRDDSKQNYAPNLTRVNPARPLDLPIDGWEMGKWRYEVWPTLPQNDDLFLNVLEPTGSATPTMVPNQRIEASSGNMVGALIQDSTNPYVVMFSKTETPQSSVTYDANYSSSLTGKHLLADMSPGTYDIYKNGAKVLSGITASSQGTLHFESTGGSTFSIVKTGEAPPPSDATSPTTPTNLTATAVSSSQINLSWSASTDNVGVTGYKIYRCAGSGCTPTTQIATVPSTGSGQATYSNTGLTASTAYTYAVSAYDGANNNSAKSSSVSATTQSLTPQCSDTIDNDSDGKIDYPLDPDCSSLTDTTENDTTPPTISSVISTTLASTTTRVNWQTNDEPATSQVEYGFTTQYGTASTLSITFTTSHSVLLSNLSPDNTTYNYRVRSKDSSNNEAISTNNTFITPGLTDVISPASTTNLTANNITQTSVDLVTWTAAGDDDNQGTASSFDIRYATGELSANTWNDASVIRATGEPTPKIAGSIMNYTLVGLTPNTTYKAALKTLDEILNQSLISNIITFTTLKAETAQTTPQTTTTTSSGGGSFIPSDDTPPPQITNLESEGSDKQIRLIWNNPVSSDYVRTIIVRKELTSATTSSTSSPQITHATSTKDGTIIYEGIANEFTDVKLKNNQTYYYSIFTIDRTPNYSSPATTTVKTIEGKMTAEIERKESFFAEATKDRQVQTPSFTIKKGYFKRTLKQGMKGKDIKKLQEILFQNKEEFYDICKTDAMPNSHPTGGREKGEKLKIKDKNKTESKTKCSEQELITGYFGKTTKLALIKFQEKYEEDILTPNNLKQGTGILGKTTVKKIEEIYGKKTEKKEIKKEVKRKIVIKRRK